MCVCMNGLNRSGAVLLLLAAVALFSGHCVYCDDGGRAEVQWQILTKLNYSSQIRLNPRILLLVTVPWSGESRSLMKELAHLVASDEVRFGSLKLMVLYKNVERMLADAIGGAEGITVLYYHNAISYKYWGRLRVQNILASVHYVMSLSPKELPLKSLTTQEELRDFLHSTDKAVLLLEFCGWIPKFVALNESMAEGKGYFGADFNKENNGTLVAEDKDNKKGMEDDMLSCSSDSGFCGISLPTQFTSMNNSFVKEAENLTVGAGESCTLFELQEFELFFQKLVTAAREFFLPPERFRFAMVRDRSLLPLLNIEEPSSWLMAVHFSGCPICSQVLKEVDDLRMVLQSQPSPVSELEDDPHGVEATLPAKRPSMLLFVDRSSDSAEIRSESQEALNVFRELAKHTELSNQIRGQADMLPDKTIENNRPSRSTFKHPRLQPASSSEKIILKDKMSITILNKGQQVTLENLVPNLQGRSVQEILTYALKRKKELKLSSLAKDAGFQLLSEDLDIEIVESLPSHSEDQPYQVLGDTPVEDGHEGADINQKQIPAVSSSGWHEVPPNPSDVEYIILEGKKDSFDKASVSSVEPVPDDLSTSTKTVSAQGWNVGNTRHSRTDDNEQKIFTGSFFFFDGQYRLLETLTGGSTIPTVVIVDPISQKHFVLSEQSVFSYSLLSEFVNDFLAGKLQPYLQSPSIVPSTRSAQRPPFVNLNFHETDSIPLVTAHTFADLVIGNKSDPRNSVNPWDRDVLVLFSNSWCGFCQRMELVVREVYRAVRGYADMKANNSRKENLMPTDAILKLPLIYMMDCTRNDCGLIIKPLLQREVYPLLVLFPAEKKNNSVSYEGDIAVSNIIKFLVAYGGSNVVDLIVNEGFPQDQNSVSEGLLTRSLHHEVVFKDLQSVAVKYQINAPLPASHEKPRLFAGCVLSATEMLLDVHPFDGSKILIVKADENSGIRGLIINKQISWDSLADLVVQGYEVLKEAPLSFGGPVMMRGMPLIALTHKSIEGQSHKVLPNIHYIEPLDTHNLLEEIRVGNQSVRDFWFFLGYSSWDWEQLFHEIAQGAWNVSVGDLERIEWPWR